MRKRIITRTLYNSLSAGVGSQQVEIPIANCRLVGLQIAGMLGYSATSYGFAIVTKNTNASGANGAEQVLATMYLAASQNAAGNATDTLFVPLSIVYPAKFPDKLYLTCYSSAAGTSMLASVVCFMEEG